MKGNCFWLLLVAVLCCGTVANADVISNIQFVPKSVCAVQHGQYVNIVFDYNISTPGGVLIFPRPFTNGALTPNYAASPSPTYTGAGIGAGYFTITAGDVIVDHVRFQVLSTDQTQLILEFFVPVEFHYGVDGIFNIELTPESPSSIEFNRDVNISFSYKAATPGGIRVFPRPFTNGALTPHYAASGSGLYTGDGSETLSFTITSGDALVDHVRFQVTDVNQTQLLKEFFVPVKYSYAAHSISEIVITPSSPDGLINGENVNVSFNYFTSEPSGVRIFARPFTDGNLTPNYSAHGSGVYATGAGSGTGFFNITTGRVNVDSIRFEMLDAAQTSVLLDYFVPVNFYYSTQKMSNIALQPSSPAYFTTNAYDTASFDYTHSNAAGAYMWVVPYTNGSFNSHGGYQGSTLVAAGSGSLTRRFTVLSGSEFVDEARFIMMNPTQTETYVHWGVPVQFYFGNQGLTGVKDPVDKPASFALEQNYPNPFNPSTTITYSIGHESFVSLRVYNILGQEVATLVNAPMTPGMHTLTFDASRLATGVYLYKMTAGDFVQTKKMVVVK